MLWPKKKSHFSYNYDTRSPVLLTLSNTAVAYTAARDGAYRTRESSPGLLARCYHLYYVGVCAELCWRTACISNVQLHNAYKALLLTDPDFCSWRTAVTSLLCCACVLPFRSKQTKFLSFMGLRDNGECRQSEAETMELLML